MMLFCPAAWGLRQVPSLLQRSAAAGSHEFKRKKVIKFRCFSLQNGQMRACLTPPSAECLHAKKPAHHFVGPSLS